MARSNIKSRARRTVRRPVRRVRIYGPELRTAIRYSTSGVIISGAKSTNYGWLYGLEWKLNADNILGGLPAHTREYKVTSFKYSATIYLRPNDEKATIDGFLKANNKSGNNYWPSQWDSNLTFHGDSHTKFFVAAFLQDQDGDSGDTGKFQTIAEVKAACLPGKYRYGGESGFVRISGKWTPQEPSEREWLGRKAGSNLQSFATLKVLATHLTPSGWASPDVDKISLYQRAIHVDVDFVFQVTHRGNKSTVSLSTLHPSSVPSPSGSFEALQI